MTGVDLGSLGLRLLQLSRLSLLVLVRLIKHDEDVVELDPIRKGSALDDDRVVGDVVELRQRPGSKRVVLNVENVKALGTVAYLKGSLGT